MASQTLKRRVTGFSISARRPFKLLSRVTHPILYHFKSRRHKSDGSEVSDQESTFHSNFHASGDKTAAIVDVQPVQQPAETCPTLDYKPPTLSNSPQDLKDRGPSRDNIDPRMLAIASVTLELFSPIAPLLPQPKACNLENVLFKTCPQSSERVSQRHRSGPERREHKRARRSHHGESNRGNPDDNENDGDGNDGGRKPDGLRYPDFGDMPSLLDCPFRKYDPVRYQCCNGYERFCDVKLHVKRQHLLGEGKPYCPKCRIEFFRGGRAALEMHARGTCRNRSIQEAGMLLPREWDECKRGLEQMGANAPGQQKWKYMWWKSFSCPPPSPFVGFTNADTSRRGAEASFSTALPVMTRDFGDYHDDQQIWPMSQQTLDSMFSSLTTEPLSSQQDTNDNYQFSIDPGDSLLQNQHLPVNPYYDNPDLTVFGYDHSNQDWFWDGHRQ